MEILDPQRFRQQSEPPPPLPPYPTACTYELTSLTGATFAGFKRPFRTNPNRTNVIRTSPTSLIGTLSELDWIKAPLLTLFQSKID